jgi:hypothetical protein
MFSKWKIKGIDGYLFGEDKNLYRLPYTFKNRSYGLREVKKQYPSRYRINNNWVSENVLKSLIYLDEKPIELIKVKETPF